MDDSTGSGGRPALPGDGHVAHVPPGAYETAYFLLAVLFVGMLLLTNVIGTKLFALPLDLPLVGPVLGLVDRLVQWVMPGEGGGASVTLTAGIITYPLTFLLTDIVSEIYGRRRADVMVLVGFAASLLMLAVITAAAALPPSEIWRVPEIYSHVFAQPYLAAGGAAGSHVAAQAAYQFTFDAPGTLLFASMTAYLVAQLVDNRLFHFWRRLTGGRWLWLRNNASTSVSQLVDTIIVNGIFLHFYWELPFATIAAVIIAVYAVKLLIALSDTPLCYLGVWMVRRVVTGGGTAGSESAGAAGGSAGAA